MNGENSYRGLVEGPEPGRFTVMELKSIALFDVMKKRLNWLTQRQEILSQNVANSDSPGYRPRDLKPFEFKELLRREGTQLNMATSRKDHLGGRRKRIRDFDMVKERKPFETSPQGNAVILEEQMMKVGETTAKHKLTTELYRKHMSMLRMALGRR